MAEEEVGGIDVSDAPKVRPKRGPYKGYLVHPDMPVPPTTLFRLKKTKLMDETSKDNDMASTPDPAMSPSRPTVQQAESPIVNNLQMSTTDLLKIATAMSSLNLSDDDHEEPGNDSSISDEQSHEDYFENDIPLVDDTTASNDNDEILDLTEDEVDEGNEPLYEDARLTLAVSMLLIMTFAIRHKLSTESLQDLLTLINLHCLVPNLCKNTFNLYKKFFTKVKSPIVYKYFCTKCYHYMGNIREETCTVCGTSDMISYIICIPILNQLKAIVDRIGVDGLMSYRKEREDTDGCITDVLDGRLYKEVFDGHHFRGTSMQNCKEDVHISLQINTDGVSLFRSSTFSVWPIYATINELDPKSRFTRENRLFLGHWFGKDKPRMDVFL
ncbi:uncharacterized protein LOC135501412 isoform X2 [Lineus longissimus]|uniref:uncharacterized protein LOC135501412 isoform X2 n=1 Tax=Lineus longissimus TaxID=88925 RepID=UPI00315C5169